MTAGILEREADRTAEAAENARPVAGVLAEFAGPKELVRGANIVRVEGFTKTDAFSPFPIHGIDPSLGVRPTRMPWFVLAVGICGGFGALLMQWWMNAVDYPFLISGKPIFSLPANIPVVFEVIVLTSAFATFFGMLALNRLPRHSNPLLEVERFRRVTNDRFFLYVSAEDPRFNDQDVVEMFRKAGAIWIDVVAPSVSSDRIPGVIRGAIAVLIALSLVPPVMIAWARTTTSEQPRIDLFWNMDFQDRPGPQQTSKLFADGRAMRPQIPGTVAVGDFHDNDAYYLGYLPKAEGEEAKAPEPAAPPADAAPAAAPPADAAAAAVPAMPPEPNYVADFPFEVTQARMLRGQTKFNIYCAPCHGLVGQGNGLVAIRATELMEPTWLPPTNLTNDVVAAQPVGKIFDTITNGRRKMAGYAAQIEPDDRWSIVLYVRALQRSQRATLQEVPQDEAKILNNRK